jgi:alpha-glucuronidase
MKPLFIAWLLFIVFVSNIQAENGYDLWLRYQKIEDAALLQKYQRQIKGIKVSGDSPTLKVALTELERGLKGLLGFEATTSNDYNIVIGKFKDLAIENFTLSEDLGKEGYQIFIKNKNIIITANEDAGVLYGVFHFLKLLQTHQDIAKLNITESPKLDVRVLNHWDNLDRTVERGYAGFSIWNWHTLPEYIDQKYIDYARANASIGINGAVLTNVNANALVLRNDYLEKVKALADVFRPYNIKVYLTARFSAPIELGGMETADPTVPKVQQWWNDKVSEIYKLIPDFGGFVVKANSEGQPGPQNYGKSHVEGANMIADALAPHGGIVMWRAFVYSAENTDDRHRQAFTEFVPMDGKFRENVLIQVKNGAIDFQPREPAHPMFGAMPKTPLLMEFQVTQEYLGQGTHLVYLAPMWKEVLEFDTHAEGIGSTVAKVIDGSLNTQKLTGIAGVANIGNEINWTGYHFGQANWHAFGRLAWNPYLSSEKIADEWIRMTFTNDENFVNTIKGMLLNSHEVCVNYMSPLGLHHIMATGHHYGPGPWVGNLSRPEWNPVYYHRADTDGVGFDRTPTGTNATEQYFDPVEKMFADKATCPEKYLLWFHYVGWKETLASGKTLWEELLSHYYKGAEDVEGMRKTWQSVKGKVDEQRFREVDMMLQIQEKEAKWWRDACLLYFQTFSKMEIPSTYEQPEKDLEYYKNLTHPYAPGIRPRW